MLGAVLPNCKMSLRNFAEILWGNRQPAFRHSSDDELWGGKGWPPYSSKFSCNR
jgi:hypothetical protein